MANASLAFADLPYDVLTIISRFLLPYDIVSFSSTCRTARPLLTDKALWLDVADTVSYSRPLPFTANQAVYLSTGEICRACMRVQRIAVKWSKPDIRTQHSPRLIKFADERQITYFTFLPGSFHILVYDRKNTLSCWSVGGVCLATWQGDYGAQLSRWKPFDDSDGDIEVGLGRDKQAVEVIVEYQRTESYDARFEIVHLVYCGDTATFTSVQKFSVPGNYEPFSAMSQDELRGTLVAIPPSVDEIDSRNPGMERVGIYLTDVNSNKSICIDTGLVPSYVPQALLSSLHLVLYWESPKGAHVASYDISTLRSIISDMGYTYKHPGLRNPIFLPPATKYLLPFNVLTAPFFNQRSSTDESSTATATTSDLDLLRSNIDWYPIVIPKWTTLREDVYRHRTRSVLTFSRTLDSDRYEDLFYFMNMLDDTTDDHEMGFGTSAWHVENVPHLSYRANDHSRDLRTVISHHYYDYTSQRSELKPTVIAEAILRKAQNLRIVNDNVVEGEQIIQDSDCYGGCAVMGGGGRCALWIEVADSSPQSQPNERGSVSVTSPIEVLHRMNLNHVDDDDDLSICSSTIKLATFPSPNIGKTLPAIIHKELDVPEGMVSTLHLPNSIDVNHANTFDLDDVRGLVGVATLQGELFIIDYT